jgi:Tol biopolymer transport system component
VDGTEFREVYAPVAGGGWTDLFRWTPDGQSLLFAANVIDTSGTRTWRIMRVAATGGAAVPEGLESANLNSLVTLPQIEKGNISCLDISPDGSRLVFSSRARPTYNVWALDHLAATLRP